MRARCLLVFTENYARGGGNRYCVDLVNALAGAFDRVVLAANAGGIFPEDRARLAANVEVRAVPFLTRSRARHALRRLPRPVRAPALALLSLADPLLFRFNAALFGRLVGRTRADAVLSCNGGYPAARAALAMIVAAEGRGVPAVLSVVSVPTPRRAFVARYDERVDRAVWRAARRVIVNAHAIAEALTAQHEMPPALARVVYNGLPDAPVPAADDSTPVIGFVSRLDRAKGVLVLVEAFRLLAPRWPSLRLRLVGRGDASDAVAARVTEFGLADRVEATGYVAGDIDPLLASFRVYVFPSFHEGLPYSILEAMRAACPIVSTAVGGIPEVLEHGREALLVAPGDAEGLAGAIEQLLTDPTGARQLARAARARFERDHRLDRMASEVLRVFAESGALPAKAALSPPAILLEP